MPCTLDRVHWYGIEVFVVLFVVVRVVRVVLEYEKVEAVVVGISLVVSTEYGLVS